MAKVVVNFSNTKMDSGFAPIPPGIYHAQVDATNSEVQGEEPKRKIRLDFIIADGEYKGKKVVDYFYLTEKALWRLAKIARIMGENLEGDLSSVVLDTYAWHGGELLIKVIQESYTDKNGIETIGNKVADMMPYVEGVVPIGPQPGAVPAAPGKALVPPRGAASRGFFAGRSQSAS